MKANKGRLKNEPILFLFRKMWKFAKGHRKIVVVYLCFFIIANLVLLLEPMIFGKIINEIQVNGFDENNFSFLATLVLSILGLQILFWIFHGTARLMEYHCAFKTELAYRNYLMNGVLNLGLTWHSIRDSGDIIDRVNKSSEGLYSFSKQTYSIVSAIVKAAGTVIILFYFNIAIAIMAMVLLVLSFIIIYKFDKALVLSRKKLNEYENKMSAQIIDFLTNITTIKILHIEDIAIEGLNKAFLAPFSLFKKLRKLIELKWFVGNTIFKLIVVIPLIFYMYTKLKAGEIVEVGTFSALYLYLSNLISVFFTFANLYEEMIINKTRIENAEKVESDFETIESQERMMVKKWNFLSISEVSFSYGEDVKHVNKVSFKLNKGDRIALIGESGSGKTTFLKVMHGMYPEAIGSISFDEGEVIKTSFSDINLATMLVPQEPEVFSASIKENITLGIDFTNKEIDRAIEIAAFSNVISELPKGMESVINEKGVNLSGGQKQRLALARALLFSHSKEIVLLDESTSSVDPENEVNIYQGIFKEYKDKTIIASIHKMNLLKYFDRIIIFANGEIVDEGTFDDLLIRNSKFKREWEKYISQHKT